MNACIESHLKQGIDLKTFPRPPSPDSVVYGGVCSGQTSERLLKPGSCASAAARMRLVSEFVFTPDRWKLKQRERELHSYTWM